MNIAAFTLSLVAGVQSFIVGVFSMYLAASFMSAFGQMGGTGEAFYYPLAVMAAGVLIITGGYMAWKRKGYPRICVCAAIILYFLNNPGPSMESIVLGIIVFILAHIDRKNFNNKNE